MSVKPITSHSQFISTVVMTEKGKTAIVDFVSERCPHCKAIAPTFDELASKFSSDKVEFYVIDGEKLDDVSFEVGGITSYPTFVAFKDGNKMEESTFGAARERLQEFVEKYCSL
ncbi:thioredoxin-like protein [Suillus decipiens]|nr:thioredoxin-like protein [Suillus decipiens]